MEDSGVTILLYLYYFGRPVIMIAGLVLGIVIICTKDKITKLLGAMIMIGMINSLMDAVYVVGLHFVGIETVMVLANAKNILSILFGFAVSIILYIYAKKRYGTKLITGIILIAGGNILSSVFGFIFNKVASNIDFDSAQYGYLMSIISLITALVFSTVWFIIFFKNRHKENELKLLWFDKALNVAACIFSLVNNICMLFAFNGTPSHADIYETQISNNTILMIGSLVFVVLNLLMNIYIVAKGRKASKTIEPAVA